MTWGVDEIDVPILPFTEGGSALDCYPSLALEFHRVHLCPHSVIAFDFVDFLDFPGVV
jgi:hypothetical protein